MTDKERGLQDFVACFNNDHGRPIEKFRLVQAGWRVSEIEWAEKDGIILSTGIGSNKGYILPKR